MLTSSFILRDSADSYFDDLITLDKAINLNEIRQAIEDFKEFNEEYSNEDIYCLIKDYFGAYSIEWVGQYEIVEY